MERTAGKELALAPLQEWGEETEDGVVYSVSLRRQRSQHLSPGEGSGSSQTHRPSTDAFLHYRTSKVRALRAAPLDRLVRELVFGDPEQDPSFIPAFLATHRAFVPTSRVLDLLLPPPPPPLPPGVEIKKTEGRDLSFNKNLRAVVSVLGSWLRDHPQDFWDPPAHSDLENIRTFLGWAAPVGVEAKEAEKLLGDFLEEAEQEQKEKLPQVWAGFLGATQIPGADLTEYCLDEVPEGQDLLDFSLDEVAQQLTLTDVELFSRVRPCECLGSVWSQRDRPGARGTAPTVRATVAQFNMVTGCVLGSVLGEPNLATLQRAQQIEKWICIAQRCRELRNFSSLRAILSALQSNPIYRLKHCWGAVSQEPLSIFRKLSQIFSDENNHLSSREILFQEEDTEGPQEEDSPPRSLPSKLPPGPVPYLGTFLTDLIMLDTALPDMLEGDLINFEKRRKEWEILAHIQQLQKRCQSYCLKPCPRILAALHVQRQLTEEQSYRVSRVIEPPAASCPSSPRVQRHISLTKRLSAKLSRERGSSPCGSPGDPSSPTSSPRLRDTSGSPPASPGLQHPNTKFLLNADLLGPQPLASPLSGLRLPLPALQGSEARVIRVSIDNDHGNLYRSILLTSQDKAPSVVQRALQKHNVVQPWARDYQLFQLLPGDKELLIPDSANVFYAMSPAAPGDFMLRRKEGARHTTSISPT
ncbi:PREDICTED: ral guanine nucleotide dissociation stimulator-like 3 isoform X2 [Condylura cristata]|uniref:ral guanine nucleotide dissociation stimulator-like 3 isoform X2 n=1 Tax=Condylura cristata TaxID=143302 RepID=UPI000642F5A7|nr:PREDICTED: ral guanine nucleotide dissociation stimulator-like 3 isoform X2 [Condylura cristata]